MSASPAPPQNAQRKMVDEPALFITTQTTIPLLTTVLLTFSAILLAIAAVYQNNLSVPLPIIQVSLRDATLTALSVAALLFVFTTEACVKSQGWDYFAVSQERRAFEGLEEARPYIDDCLRRSRLWHALAARAYNLGLFFQLLGASLLAWLFAPLVSIFIWVYLVIRLAISISIMIFGGRARDWMEKKIAHKMESILKVRQ